MNGAGRMNMRKIRLFAKGVFFYTPGRAWFGLAYFQKVLHTLNRWAFSFSFIGFNDSF